MCSITLIAQEAAMATTQLTRAATKQYEVWTPPVVEQNPKRLRMNWVVVIDELGRPRLRMRWSSEQNRRE
jgi:hypothetical protein